MPDCNATAVTSHAPRTIVSVYVPSLDDVTVIDCEVPTVRVNFVLVYTPVAGAA